jgi:predicted metal-dependent enzyme (double-stranded beta helix superfamily)
MFNIGELRMTYKFDSFCSDCREAYDKNTGKADIEIIRQNLTKLLNENSEFVEKNCGKDLEYGVHELFKDPQTGFIVYAHNFKKGRTSPPHDHGASWAVYGQARKFTDMTEYRRLDDKSKVGFAQIEETKKYRLDVGMVGKFGPHDIHQIHFEDDASFVRVTGSDLFKEDTLTYNPEENSVTVIGTISIADNSRVAASS